MKKDCRLVFQPCEGSNSDPDTAPIPYSLKRAAVTCYVRDVEARRLAERLLLDHAKEGHFNVWLNDAEDIDLIALRLQEFGCTVEVDHIKRQIEIDPPPPQST